MYISDGMKRKQLIVVITEGGKDVATLHTRSMRDACRLLRRMGLEVSNDALFGLSEGSLVIHDTNYTYEIQEQA